MKTPSQHEIEEYVTDKNVTPIKIIHIAIVAAAVAFATVCFVLYFTKIDSATEYYGEENIQNILVIALLVIASFDYSIVFLFPNMLIRMRAASDLLKKGTDSSMTAEDLLGFAVTHQIVKLALLEGVTLFGLVIFMISVLNKSVYFELVPWIGILPLLIIIGYVISNFPNRQKVIELIVYKIIPEIN